MAFKSIESLNSDWFESEHGKYVIFRVNKKPVALGVYLSTQLEQGALNREINEVPWWLGFFSKNGEKFKTIYTVAYDKDGKRRDHLEYIYEHKNDEDIIWSEDKSFKYKYVYVDVSKELMDGWKKIYH